MGTPLIVILDHFMLARGCAKGEWEGSLRVVDKMALMWGAAERSETDELDGPAVITRLPFCCPSNGSDLDLMQEGFT